MSGHCTFLAEPYVKIELRVLKLESSVIDRSTAYEIQHIRLELVLFRDLYICERPAPKLSAVGL